MPNLLCGSLLVSLLASATGDARLPARLLPHHNDDATKLDKVLAATTSSAAAADTRQTSSKLPKGVQDLLRHPRVLPILKRPRVQSILQQPWIKQHVPADIYEPPPPPTEVDVVISGGGLKGYFILGARHALETRDDLRVRRYSGTSAGAWTAMFMATGLSNGDWLATYTLTAAVARRAEQKGSKAPALMEAYRDSVWPWLKTVLPADAYKRCSGRLFITLTKMDKGFKPVPVVVSEFASNEELFEACVASSSVPKVTQKGIGSFFKGEKCFDGLFSNNVPVFSDKVRPQLVFDLGKIPISLRTLVKPSDPCIEGLAVSGALQTARFLDGRRGDPKMEPLSWVGFSPGREYPNHREENEQQADGREHAAFPSAEMPVMASADKGMQQQHDPDLTAAR